ncbi:hypothetical protein [Methanolobus tindarius]|uniref:hypothetical protein n=1 Tax=Methanolobus tindarius TaxID=2221 RepID=UPI00065000F0|nr:hypothetical protein [Methanolobus tindarius]
MHPLIIVQDTGYLILPENNHIPKIIFPTEYIMCILYLDGEKMIDTLPCFVIKQYLHDNQYLHTNHNQYLFCLAESKSRNDGYVDVIDLTKLPLRNHNQLHIIELGRKLENHLNSLSKEEAEELITKIRSQYKHRRSFRAV